MSRGFQECFNEVFISVIAVFIFVIAIIEELVLLIMYLCRILREPFTENNFELKYKIFIQNIVRGQIRTSVMVFFKTL